MDKLDRLQGQGERSFLRETGEQSFTIDEILEQLDSTKQELEKAHEEAKELSQQLATTVPRSQALQMRRELEAKIDELTNENQELKESVEDERKEREWFESELRAQYKAASLTDQEMKNLQDFVRNLHSLVEDKNKAIETHKDERETLLRQFEETKEEVGRLKKETASKTRSLARLEETSKELAVTAKTKDELVMSLQKDAASARRHYDQLHKEVRRQTEVRSEVENQLKLVRGQIKVTTEQVKVRGRQEKIAKRQIERMKLEKEALQRNVVKALAQEKKQTSLVTLGEKERKKSQNLVLRTINDLQQQERLITHLQDAKDRQLEETANVEAKVVALAGEVEARDREVESVLRRQAVLRTNLEMTSAILNTLRRENLALDRRLSLLKTEADEDAEKTKRQTYLANRMRETCKKKEREVISVTKDLQIQKEVDRSLKGEVEQLRTNIEGQHITLRFMEKEKYDLQQILEDREVILDGLKRVLREEQQQRAVESTSLCRRNDEVSALRERVRLLEHILRRGNKEYEARCKEIRILTTELDAIKDERDVLNRQISLGKSLKEELARQQKLLVTTQKEKVLLERDTINTRAVTHRWAALQASNPENFELVKKNHQLQKRFLNSTEKLVALENEVSQKEKENDALRRLLERTSSFYEGGPESQTIRITLQNQLRNKEEQLKSITAALNSATLKIEDIEQERKELRTKNEKLTIKTTQLQKKLQKVTK